MPSASNLRTVLRAAVIGIGIERIGCTDTRKRAGAVNFIAVTDRPSLSVSGRFGSVSPVPDAVAVADRVDGLAVAVQVFRTVGQAVVVRIGVVRICGRARVGVADESGRGAGKRHTIAIADAAVDAVGRHAGFNTVVNAVVVAVDIQRIGGPNTDQATRAIDFIAIGQAIVVAVAVQRIGLARIEYAVAADFLAVGQAIVVGVGIVRDRCPACLRAGR